MSDRPSRSLHVAQISFFRDPEGRRPEQLLEAWPTLVDVAEAASRAGVRISVVQACAHRSMELERGGVSYYFLPFDGPSGRARLGSLAELLSLLQPQVLHVHGLAFTREMLALAALAPNIPIIAQDHASRPPRIWRRPMWRRGLSVLAGAAFCSERQALPFADAGLLAAHTRVYEVPESTARFMPGDREAARAATRIAGAPALLWVGHLDANKDPLTVLDGVSAAARALPELRLWCCFGVAPLLSAVQERIRADAQLRDRVQLLGRVPHQTIEQLMRAADLFVLGSHHEGSGYSLIESLACGLPPVVTDIPSFRALTGNATVGQLWPCDDAGALSASLQLMASRIGPDLRAAVRAHFDRELSFEALGAKLAAMYQDAFARAASSSCGEAMPAMRRSAAL
jgi:glycosyltransferase involved in cell wall biosynthesis